jgi:hypothetical protein
MNKIYIIVWTGRDSDTEHWDKYPCLEDGFFTDKEKAQEYADYLNASEEPEYDEYAEEESGYGIVEILKNKGK